MRQRILIFLQEQLTILFITLLCVIVLYLGIHTNLLFDVDMQVKGMGSYNNRLRWYSDQLASTLPVSGIVSFPLLVWRLLMLAWSFWLVSAIIRWASWGWASFSHEGFWRLNIKSPSTVKRSSQADEKDVSQDKEVDEADEKTPSADEQEKSEDAAVKGAKTSKSDDGEK